MTLLLMEFGKKTPGFTIETGRLTSSVERLLGDMIK